ncbi:MAG: hypothetical protein WA324_19190, partial [Bryobacteraceae bacterium]
MSTRSIRRAAERKAAKAARKESRLAHSSSEEIAFDQHENQFDSYADDRIGNAPALPSARPAPEWSDPDTSTAFEQLDPTEAAMDAGADWSTSEAEPHTPDTPVPPDRKPYAWKSRPEIRQLTFVTHDHPPESSVDADPIGSEPDSPADQPIPEAHHAKPPTPARLAANAANAANSQRSTGPRTAEGKAKSRLNAVRTGLTGRTVLLPTDDAAIYRRHVQDFVDEFQPVGPRESELVQTLADHSWRLDRIASLEMAFYAHGLELFHEQFASRGELQGAFVQMQTFLQYEKQFRNLQIQEMRIRRNRDKDTAELHRLQHTRLYAKREVTVKQVV